MIDSSERGDSAVFIKERLMIGPICDQRIQKTIARTGIKGCYNTFILNDGDIGHSPDIDDSEMINRSVTEERKGVDFDL